VRIKDSIILAFKGKKKMTENKEPTMELREPEDGKFSIGDVVQLRGGSQHPYAFMVIHKFKHDGLVGGKFHEFEDGKLILQDVEVDLDEMVYVGPAKYYLAERP